VAVDFDADEGTLTLPVEFRICDVEEIACSNDILAGDGHQTNAGRLRADLGGPVAK
jgi:hypothetical protein